MEFRIYSSEWLWNLEFTVRSGMEFRIYSSEWLWNLEFTVRSGYGI